MTQHPDARATHPPAADRSAQRVMAWILLALAVLLVALGVVQATLESAWLPAVLNVSIAAAVSVIGVSLLRSTRSTT